ncbi:MAG: DUF429 domain-containing protein [Candidatus Rokubacteria bacterium]|nr:DUF429 domain-containing protein [Candidatus Rokubacteria bacterium]
MITLGIDLASQPERTGACVVEWHRGGAAVRSVVCGATDAELLDRMRDVSRVGIDVPFGWPDAFVDLVTAHHRGAPAAVAHVADLRYRETDREVHRLTGRWPLSVSSDLIAVPTFRAARLLTALAARGEPVDRAGGGKCVEAYPAAALERWGFEAAGYKGADGRERRRALLQAIEARTAAWLTLDDPLRATCADKDDALDALVAALVARAAALGLCEPVPEASRARAAREGWIALPTRDSLDRLARG